MAYGLRNKTSVSPHECHINYSGRIKQVGARFPMGSKIYRDVNLRFKNKKPTNMGRRKKKTKNQKEFVCRKGKSRKTRKQWSNNTAEREEQEEQE